MGWGRELSMWTQLYPSIYTCPVAYPSEKEKKNYVNVSCFSSLLLLFSKILCLYYYLLFFI